MLRIDKNLWTFKIEKLNDYMYVGIEETNNDCWDFYDSDKKFIDSFYGNERELNEFVDKIRNIKHISELIDLGLSLNMIFATSLEDLYEGWLDYIDDCFYTREELIENGLTFEEFLEELPINRVGQNYFIVNYTEI